MSRQVQIWQAHEDDVVLARWLWRRYRLLCLPAAFGDASLGPHPVGSCSARSQLLFFEGDVGELQKEVKPVPGVDGMFYVYPPATHGRCIEWDRTEREDEGVYRTGSTNRLYFCPDKSVRSSEALAKVMSAVTRYVKKEYPLRTQHGRWPHYIGPALARSLEQGESRLLTRAGTEPVLIRNSQ